MCRPTQEASQRLDQHLEHAASRVWHLLCENPLHVLPQSSDPIPDLPKRLRASPSCRQVCRPNQEASQRRDRHRDCATCREWHLLYENPLHVLPQSSDPSPPPPNQVRASPSSRRVCRPNQEASQRRDQFLQHVAADVWHLL